MNRLYPHLLRHTYATLFLINGGNVFLLRHNLGHTSLEMVRRYVHLASRTAAVRSQSFSPLCASTRLEVKEVRRFRHNFSPVGAWPGEFIRPPVGVRSPARTAPAKAGAADPPGEESVNWDGVFTPSL